MSDNKPPTQAKPFSSELVINKPNLNSDSTPPIQKKYGNNQLGAYSQSPNKPPVKGYFKPPIRPNPF